jgi:hypothetical protein
MADIVFAFDAAIDRPIPRLDGAPPAVAETVARGPLAALESAAAVARQSEAAALVLFGRVLDPQRASPAQAAHLRGLVSGLAAHGCHTVLSAAEAIERVVRGAMLDNTIIQNVDLSGRDLSGCSLRRARFDMVNLDRCNFSGATLDHAALAKCSLAGVRASRALMGLSSASRTRAPGAQAGAMRSSSVAADSKAGASAWAARTRAAREARRRGLIR